ncbi:MAG: glutamate formimidoyltransferase [Capsulimonadaceae bacterium]|nr:glutamate formimidoyltransferase [Capsulimonadaceae bacterium]
MPYLPGALVQSAPNFSEGRDQTVIEAIVAAADGIEGVRVADWSADTDHNRMVVTLVGAPCSVLNAAIAMAGASVRLIDLSKHEGVHPRLGAIDVLPFVPLVDITLDECVSLARDAAKEIASRFDLPVFLYEAASPLHRALPSIRKRAFVDFGPDFGPSKPHPTAGAVVVGARSPLIAYNLDLGCNDLSLARSVARELRRRYPDCVRALGLALPSRGIVQVSMNIISPENVSLPEIIAFVSERAPVLRGELIGALPGYTAFDAVKSALKLGDLKPGQVLLENWIR